MQGVPKPVVLAILDGFGIARATRGNAIRAAHAPHLTTIEQYFPFTALQASGVAVGLPWGEVGNSEVGHMTIGAGRVLYQHLVRILNALEDGSFHKNSAFLKVIAHAKAKGSAIHLLGLVSTGSVHSSLEHLYALLDLVAEPDSPKAYLHVITDGRDAPLEEAGALVAELQAKIAARYPTAAIASLIGRFYAMDRDQQWNRV
ncbi:MAG: 2,3-bisphosphoglycerate-independent phosphoglycerate mutase, partial [Patescibacteria group bacterium]